MEVESENLKKRRTLQTSSDLPFSSFSNFANAGTSKKVKRKTLVTLKETPLLFTVKEHRGPIMCITIDKVRSKIFTGGWDQLIRSWRIEQDTAYCDFIFKGHTGYVSCMFVFSEHLFSGGSTGEIIKWNCNNGGFVKIYHPHHAHVQSIKVTPTEECTILFSASSDAQISGINAETGQQIYLFPGHSESIRKILLYETENITLISCSRDSTIKLWSLDKGTSITLEGHKDCVWAMKIVDSTLFTCSWDKTARSWDITTGKSLFEFRGHTGHVYCMEIVENILYTGSEDKTIKSWNIISGAHISTLFGHKGSVEVIQYFNGILYTSSGDQSIRLWNLNLGKCIGVYKHHKSPVINMAFIFDIVLSCDLDGVLCIWKSGIETKSFLVEAVQGLFSKDGTQTSKKTRERSMSDEFLRGPHLDSSLTVAINPLFGKSKQLRVAKLNPYTKYSLNPSPEIRSETRIVTVTTNPVFGKSISLEKLKFSNSSNAYSGTPDLSRSLDEFIDESIPNSILTTEGTQTPSDINTTGNSNSGTRSRGPSISATKMLNIIERIQTNTSERSEEEKVKEFEMQVNAALNKKKAPYSSSTLKEKGEGSKRLIRENSALNPLKKARSLPDLADLARSIKIMEEDFVTSIEEGNLLSVKEIFATGALKLRRFVDSEGRTPIHLATIYGQKDILRFLLAQRKIDVNKEDHSGSTALHYAASEGHTEILKLLLACHNILISLRTKNKKNLRPVDVGKTKQICSILKYAEKKKDLTGKKKDSKLEVVFNPLFGRSAELAAIPIIKELQQKNMTIEQLKKQIEELQQKNEELEKEINKFVPWNNSSIPLKRKEND